MGVSFLLHRLSYCKEHKTALVNSIFQFLELRCPGLDGRKGKCFIMVRQKHYWKMGQTEETLGEFQITSIIEQGLS